jgi:phage shock protein C
MSDDIKRLYRSRDDRMLAGVCAGLAEYFEIDPTVVRLAFTAAFFFGLGSILVVYFIMLLVVPEAPLNEITTN